MRTQDEFRPYTLWSRGRLLGETDLGFVYRERGFRCGWFHPTALGERLMPFATGVAPALRTEFMIGPDATAHADVLAAADQEEALELELHGPDGNRIATESIGIIDTEYLLSLKDPEWERELANTELPPELEAEIEEMVKEVLADREFLADEPAEPIDLPRYQIQIQLVDWDDVP
jgi:hypothetical protein